MLKIYLFHALGCKPIAFAGKNLLLPSVQQSYSACKVEISSAEDGSGQISYTVRGTDAAGLPFCDVLRFDPVVLYNEPEHL